MNPVRARAGGLELQDGLMLAATGVKGFGEAHACERRLVGRAHFVPEPRSFREELLRVRRIAFGESHPSLGEGRAGDQPLAPVLSGDNPELLGRRSGPVDVADGDLDLDLGFE